MSTRPNLDLLPQVQELNRAFLELVQTRALRQGDCLGLPADARLALCAAGEDRLAAVALLPCALFRLNLDCDVADDGDEAPAPFDAAHHELSLSMLWSARLASRQSVYQARLLFGLDDAEILMLRELPLAGLRRLARRPDILRCAFLEREWLWRKLLTDARPEARRELALVALQPGVAREWPERRPAQPVA